MNLAALKGFVAIVELGSISAAAKRMGISQPALSKSLKTLEAYNGVPLLVRRRSGAVPTEFGRTLFEHARIAVREVVKAEQSILQMRDCFDGTISLAVSPAPSVDLIPRALNRFRKDYPDVVVSIREALFPRIGQQLANSTVDMAVGPTKAISSTSGYAVSPLMDFPMAVFASRDNPLRDETDLRELMDSNWLEIGGVGPASALIRETFLKLGLSPPVASVQSYSVTCAISLLRSSELITILPRILIERSGLDAGLVALPIAQDIAPVPCGIICDPSRPLSRATRILGEYIEKAAAQLVGSVPT